MMFSVNAEQWATETFSDAELGDLRRTKRLVKITASLANHIDQSIVQSLESAAYRPLEMRWDIQPQQSPLEGCKLTRSCCSLLKRNT